MSKWKKYLEERERLYTIETDEALLTYRLGEAHAELQDLYVLPEHRKSGKAKKLLNCLENMLAKRGIYELYTCCDPKANNAHEAMVVILRGGFRLHSVDGSLVWFKKDIIIRREDG